MTDTKKQWNFISIDHKCVWWVNTFIFVTFYPCGRNYVIKTNRWRNGVREVFKISICNSRKNHDEVLVNPLVWAHALYLCVYYRGIQLSVPINNTIWHICKFWSVRIIFFCIQFFPAIAQMTLQEMWGNIFHDWYCHRCFFRRHQSLYSGTRFDIQYQLNNRTVHSG